MGKNHHFERVWQWKKIGEKTSSKELCVNQSRQNKVLCTVQYLYLIWTDVPSKNPTEIKGDYDNAHWYK